MEKKVKKKIKIKLLPFFIVLLIGGLGYLSYLLIIDLPIKNIYINGNSILTDQEIIELAKIEDYPSFVKTTSKTIKKRIEKNDYIENVKVTNKFFNQVIIKVTENKPLFIDTEGMLVLEDETVTENDKNLAVATLINYTPDTKYSELIKKLAKIDDNVLKKVSEIKYEPTEQDKDRFGLYMNDGNLVYLTLTKFDKIDYYDSITAEISCKKGILNLDSGNHFETKIDNCE